MGGLRTYPGGLRHTLRSAAEVVRAEGAVKFAGRILPWSPARKYSVYTQTLDRIVAYPPPPVPCLVRPAGKDDIRAIMDLRPGYYTRALLEKRFETGHMALIGFAGTEPIYCHWALVGSFEVPYLHGRLVLGPEEALTDEIFVRPRFRRSGIYTHGGGEIRKALRGRGFRRIYSVVASWNDVPRKLMIRSGMTEIARLRCLSLPGLARVRWSGGVEVHDDGSLRFHALA